MKRLSMALAATALLALGACSTRNAANNTSAVDTTNDVYDVAPDSMNANDLGNMSADNMSAGGNMAGNGSSTSNASHSGSNASHNAGNSASNASRNAH
jgi:hypothetical protein